MVTGSSCHQNHRILGGELKCLISLYKFKYFYIKNADRNICVGGSESTIVVFKFLWRPFANGICFSEEDTFESFVGSRVSEEK